MFIEQIDENKIKVTVDVSEQQEFGITYETMNYSDCNTRKLCEEIMSKARDQVGFFVGNAKLLVEARQSSNGAVTLYLSRIPLSEKEEEELFGQTLAFREYDDLLECCRLLSERSGDVTYSALYEYERRFYLYFEIITKPSMAEHILSSLLEYAEKTRLTDGFLSEHGKTLLSSDAILKVSAAQNV